MAESKVLTARHAWEIARVQGWKSILFMDADGRGRLFAIDDADGIEAFLAETDDGQGANSPYAFWADDVARIDLRH